MTEPADPAPPLENRAAMPRARRAYHLGLVTKYLEANRARFTEEALVEAARAQGYPEDVVEEARLRARANEASAPIRHRARRWIQAAYLVTFAVLTIGMLASEYAQRSSSSYIGTAVLAVTLGIALFVSLAWLRRRGGGTVGDRPVGMVILLSVPIVLLVAVAGLCVATGLPIPRPY
jgi:predicted small integral membrane protein